MSDLEKHLGAQLLIRSTRRLDLTDAGAAYVQACRSILDQVQQAEQVVAGEYSTPRGELVITAPVVFGRVCVLPVVNEFLRAYEQIDVRLVLADRIVHLLDDHIDVAVRIGQLPDSGLTATRVGDVRRIVCASPEYFSRQGLPNRLEALSEHTSIAIENASVMPQWHFGEGKNRTTVSLNSRLIVNTVEAALDAAIAGVGMARLLSYQAASACHKGLLQVALSAFEPPPSPVSLVYSAQGGSGVIPVKLRAFLDFARPRLRQHLTELSLPDR